MSQEDHRIVVVGGGVAGLDVATRLSGQKAKAGRPLHVTLIDKETAHVWKPMLHTIAAGTRDVVDQQAAYLAQAHRRGFSFELGEASSLDTAGRRVEIAALTDRCGEELVPKRSVAYDTLILALGSQAIFLRGVHASGIRT